MDIWNGYNKAFTLSYDDGVESDKRLIEIINRYNMKCTFNLNSSVLGSPHTWEKDGFVVRRLPLDSLKEVYKGHEIAVHGAKHLVPTELDDEKLHDEFVVDRDRLKELFGVNPVGMAYAYGAFNDKVVDYLTGMGLRYARTVWDSMSFDLQDDLMRFRPTCHHNNEKVFDLLDEFIASDSDKPQLFYLWGHSYEFDADRNWDRLEAICEKLAGRDDIFFGTNREVFGI